jgi:hypothetical protein
LTVRLSAERVISGLRLPANHHGLLHPGALPAVRLPRGGIHEANSTTRLAARFRPGRILLGPTGSLLDGGLTLTLAFSVELGTNNIASNASGSAPENRAGYRIAPPEQPSGRPADSSPDSGPNSRFVYVFCTPNKNQCHEGNKCNASNAHDLGPPIAWVIF